MLSSKLSVGVHILSVLACKRGEPMTSEFIAGSVNTNPVVIRRLLGLFRDAGYVESKNGAGGGWVLVTEPRRITLLDVLEAVEPHNELFALHSSVPNAQCPIGCNIQGVLTEIYADVQKGVAQRLARSTIASVMAKLEKPKRP
jgi:Rrf2 family protein